MRFYTAERLGQHQSLTPEGFLLCEGVPIARTGSMVYGPGETPIESGPDGLVIVDRDEGEVFRPETIASFVGKPVTNDHPSGGDVNPSNWRELAVGTVQNVRRGEGAANDVLLADLLITDASAIAAVREGKREVSCGYDADYEQTAPGRGRQLSIIGNHVALVDHGRCGPRCKIGDEDMARKTVWDRIAAAFKARDEEAFQEAVEEAKKTGDEGEGGETHVHVHLPSGKEDGVEETHDDEEGATGEEAPAWFKKYSEAAEARFKGIEEAISKLGAAEETEEEAEGEDAYDEGEENEEEEEKEETGDRRMKDKRRAKDKGKSRTGDSAGLENEFQETLARAEILAPGIRLPVFDSALTAEKTTKRLCAFRRRALEQADNTEAGRQAIRALAPGRRIKFTDMTCDAITVLFNGAAETMRSKNKSNVVVRRSTVGDDKGGGGGQIKTLADLNRANADFYAKH